MNQSIDELLIFTFYFKIFMFFELEIQFINDYFNLAVSKLGDTCSCREFLSDAFHFRKHSNRNQRLIKKLVKKS